MALAPVQQHSSESMAVLRRVSVCLDGNAQQLLRSESSLKGFGVRAHSALIDGFTAFDCNQTKVLSSRSTADLASKTKKLMEENLTGLLRVANTGHCSWFEFPRDLR